MATKKATPKGFIQRKTTRTRPSKPSWEKIQTAEGLKRSILKKRLSSKPTSKKN